MFIFGLTAEEVLHYYANGGYHSYEYYHHDQRIHQVVNQLVNGFFLMRTIILNRFTIHCSLIMINTLFYAISHRMPMRNNVLVQRMKIGENGWK